MIDEVIRLLWSDESRPTPTSHPPTPVPLTPGRKIPAEIGPTVATVSWNKPINSREGGLLSWWERGYELLTGFAVSLWAAAVAMAKSSDTQTSCTLLAMLPQDPHQAPAGGFPQWTLGPPTFLGCQNVDGPFRASAQKLSDQSHVAKALTQ